MKQVWFFLVLVVSLGFLGGLVRPAAAQTAVPDPVRTLTFASGGVELAGALYLPPGDGPFPAVVMIHGSAPETRAIF